MRASVVLLVVASLTLAGCLGASSAPAPAPGASNGSKNATGNGNATLPDGRGDSSGIKETNKTERGVGGMHHRHDYWKGKTSLVVFDEDVGLSPVPVFPDGQGSQAKSVAYVKLPRPNLVFEGTTRVEIVATPVPLAPAPLSALDPVLRLQLRTAADAVWRDPAPLPFAKPLEVAVNPKETDMPHSVSSLWVFRITTEKPELVSSFHLKVAVFRGADVVDWPGHPDFYAERSWRVVANKDVKTHVGGAVENFLYDQGGTWAPPEKLVSYGTTRLEVYANVTKITAQTGQDATGYFLEYHNATIIGPEITFGTRLGDADRNNDLKHYHFKIKTDADGMDGPYQPDSRWGFRLMATYAQLPGIGLCPGCFSYDIEYHLTVIAVHEGGPTTPAM